MFKPAAKIVAGFILIFFAYFLGFYHGQTSAPAIEKISGITGKEDQISSVDFSIFWETWKSIEDKYVGRQKLDRQKMIYEAVKGLVKSTGDPYSTFFTPDESKMLEEDISGSFSGIGAEIGFKKETLTVIAPLKDSPAEKSGILAGDQILKVDDKSTQDMALEEAVSHIRGEKGTTVSLSVFREGFSEAKEFKITRDVIKVPTIDLEMKDGIAYIKLYNFIGNIEREFRQTAVQAAKNKPKGIVLDLRNNPGGFLEAAIDIAGYFLPKGEVVAIEDFGNGEGENEFRSKGYKNFENAPLVVLINNGSASASEILAGAVKGREKIKLVGETTFGKGSVQEVISMSNGTSLKVSVARWLTPSGQSIQDSGIEPDVKVEMKKEDIENNKDPQLDKAMETISKMINDK